MKCNMSCIILPRKRLVAGEIHLTDRAIYTDKTGDEPKLQNDKMKWLSLSS